MDVFFKTLPPRFHDRSVISALKEKPWSKQGIFFPVLELENDVIEIDIVRSLPEIADAGANNIAEWNRPFFRPEPIRVFDINAARCVIDDNGLLSAHQNPGKADEQEEYSQQKTSQAVGHARALEVSKTNRKCEAGRDAGQYKRGLLAGMAFKFHSW